MKSTLSKLCRAAALALALLLTAALLPLGTLAAPEKETPLAVGSYNIHNGGDVSYDFSLIAQDIADRDLDVVGMQEVDMNTSRNGGRDTVALLTASLKEKTGVDWYGYFSRAIDTSGGEYGTAIFSRYELKDTETIDLPGGGEHRVLGHASISVDGVDVDLFNTHLEWPTEGAREAQIRAIAEKIASYPRAILTGDLNTGNFSSYAPRFPLCNFANGADLPHTFVSNEDGPIDNVISTKNTIAQKDSAMVRTGHSDHAMIVASLVLKGQTNFREEEGGLRYYPDGSDAYVTGARVICGHTYIFSEETGLLETGEALYNGESVALEAFTANGLSLSRVPASAAPYAAGVSRAQEEIADFTVTDYRGGDDTATLTDGNAGTYLDNVTTWYDGYEGYLWNVEGGRLVIGGKGEVSAPYPWANLSDYITEIDVLPDSVSAIGENAFAGLSGATKILLGEGVTSIGAGALNTGSEKLDLSIPSTVTAIGDNACGAGELSVRLYGREEAEIKALLGENNAALAGASYATGSTKTLTISPVGKGFANTDGRTLLTFTLAGDTLTLPEGAVYRLIFTAGGRQNETETYIGSALKLSEMTPVSAEGGTLSFAVCEAEGENQFIPTYDASYIVRAEIYSPQGELLYTAASNWKEFIVSEEPIFTERTAAPTYACLHNYIQLDLKEPQPITSLSVDFYRGSNRAYRWQAFATNDPTLPLSLWTPIGAKEDKTIFSTAPYSISLPAREDGSHESYRYVRVCGSHNTSNWGLHFAEVDIFREGEMLSEVRGKITDPSGKNVTKDLTNGVYYDWESFWSSNRTIPELHWYEEPLAQYGTVLWTVESGRLILSGEGTAEADPAWTKLASEIEEVVVFPNSVSGIGDGAFAALPNVKTLNLGEGVATLGEGILSESSSGVTVTLPRSVSDATGAFTGAGVEKIILNDSTSSAVAGLPEGVEVVENSVQPLTVTRRKGDGFTGIRNSVNTTTIEAELSDADGQRYTPEEGVTWRLLITDGTRASDTSYLGRSSTMKLTEPPETDYNTDLNTYFAFDVLSAEGENQFRPIKGASYEVTVQVYKDGVLRASGSSRPGDFSYTANLPNKPRTSGPAYAGHYNYVTVDLGRALPIAAIHASFYVDDDRYTQWEAYGSNDPDLPLSRWTYLTGKTGTDTTSNKAERDERKLYHVTPGEEGYGVYRYVRVCGLYDSDRWSILASELAIYQAVGKGAYPAGDVNLSGTADIDDVTAVLSYLAAPAPAPADLDLTGDGKLTVKDASRVLALLTK